MLNRKYFIDYLRCQKGQDTNSKTQVILSFKVTGSFAYQGRNANINLNEVLHYKYADDVLNIKQSVTL